MSIIMANVYIVRAAGWRTVVVAASMAAAIAHGLRNLKGEKAFRDEEKTGHLIASGEIVKAGVRMSYAPKLADYPE